jgi:hypothetical protein
MFVKKTIIAVIAASLAVNVMATEPSGFRVGKENQKSVALTIYNNNFAVVQDVREVTLPKGLVALEYLDVAKDIEPSSLLTHSVTKADAITVLEQSYKNRPLNRNSILESYIGRKLKYSKEVLIGAKYEKILREGILLSINPEIVEFGDVIEISPAGVISLSHLPIGLNLSPTLVWLLENKMRGTQDIETSYITSNIRWQADYTITLSKNSDKFDSRNFDQETFDLGSWITINNQSGADFRNAKINLVAGEVHRVAQGPRQSNFAQKERMMSMASDAAIQSEPAFEYHHYSVPNRTDILDRTDKQIRFMQASNVNFEKTYVFSGRNYNYQQTQLSEDKAEVKIRFLNNKKNNLGMPLPKGKVRVYQEGNNDSLLLLGEDIIKSKAVGQNINLTLGRAFDISSKRKQISFRRIGDRKVETSYEIKIMNAKNHSVEVIVNESMQGEWKVLQQNESSKRIDSTTLQYRLTVPKNSTKIIEYTAQSRF